MKPILSIVIATKNRSTYCLGAIDSILKIKSTEFELVIQDNSNKLELKSLIKKYKKDIRIKYNYTPPPLSSIGNFNKALEAASGKYVCMIGDDDSVNSNIVEIIKWADKLGIDSVTGTIPVNYRWPGIIKEKNDKKYIEEGSIRVEDYTCKVDRIEPRKSINKLLKNGCTNYLLFEFPKFYHGIVKKDLFDKIKKINGYYIGGLSPDIYSAISLSFYIKHAVHVDYPITIPGVCNESTSISEGEKKIEDVDIQSAPHFRDRGDYIFDQRVPPIYCPQTIWADSAIKAFEETGNKDYLIKINFISLYFQIMILGGTVNESMRSYISKKYGNKKYLIYLKMIINIPFESKTLQFFKKIKNKINKKLKINKIEDYENVKNILEGLERLETYNIKHNKDYFLYENLSKYEKKGN